MDILILITLLAILFVLESIRNILKDIKHNSYCNNETLDDIRNNNYYDSETLMHILNKLNR